SFFTLTVSSLLYTLSLHDALPISRRSSADGSKETNYWSSFTDVMTGVLFVFILVVVVLAIQLMQAQKDFKAQTDDLSEQIANSRDRKSTRLNSSHVSISYAVFCLK